MKGVIKFVLILFGTIFAILGWICTAILGAKILEHDTTVRFWAASDDFWDGFCKGAHLK